VLLISYPREQDVLTKISERVRFARRRMGHYKVIDFLAVLFDYAISGERLLEAFSCASQWDSPYQSLWGAGPVR
jgi:hypothetical protein